MNHVHNFYPARHNLSTLSAQSILFAITGCLLAVFFASGCTRSPEMLREHWMYSDLRSLDEIDAGDPSIELIAVYHRTKFNEVQIRLDFLDMPADQSLDLYLAFDTVPGGTSQIPIEGAKFPDTHEWDIFIYIAANGEASLYDDMGNAVKDAGLLIYRDTFLDAVFIALPYDVLMNANNYQFTVLATYTNAPGKHDIVGPVSSGSPPPPAALVLLTFWDAFRSATPAQALRSWDGAHTGQDSTRHGLRHLIDAAEVYQIPITISGIDRYAMYSALEYLGVDGRIRELEYVDLLYVSECVPNYWLNDYAQFTELISPDVASINGLSPSAIAQLIGIVTDTDEHDVAIIGGSFVNSNWGAPNVAEFTMGYISAHPWIRIIDLADLSSTRCMGRNSEVDYQIINKFHSIPPNRLKELAWSTYLMLSDKDGTELDQIQDNYINQVGHILAAAKWANSPLPIEDCSEDIDWDGDAECVLATDQIFTSYELSGGYLAFAFALSGANPHQLIGPTYQLTVGLSDRLSWNEQDNLSADPAQILGAFTDPHYQFNMYEYKINDGVLEMFAPNMAIRKLYKLNNQSISVQITTINSYTKHQIPFIIDPWIRAETDWASRYSVDEFEDHWQLSVVDEIVVQVYSSDKLSGYSFLGPWEAISFPEDPNFNYTPGYFLPFPLVLLEVTTSDMFTTSIQISP